MGSSPDAKIGWGIDLGFQSEGDWDEGKLAPLGQRFGSDGDGEDGEDLYDWETKTLPALYVNTAERDARFEALSATFDRDNATQEQRAQYAADREAINAEYRVPVSVELYGYEWGGRALLLTRSYTTIDWGSTPVDPASLAQPTDDELAHLRVAVEALGVAWDPTDVKLLLMAAYG